MLPGAELQAQEKAHNETIEELRRHYTTHIEEQTKQQEKAQREIDSLNTRIEQLTAAKDAENARVKALKEELTGASSKMQQKTTALAKMKAETEKLREAQRTAQAETQAVTENAKTRSTEQQQQLREREQTIRDLQAEQAKIQGELTALTRQKEESDIKVSDLESELTRVRQELEELQGKTEISEEEIQKRFDRFKKAHDDELTETQNQLTQLQEENERLSAQLQSSSEQGVPDMPPLEAAEIDLTTVNLPPSQDGLPEGKQGLQNFVSFVNMLMIEVYGMPSTNKAKEEKDIEIFTAISTRSEVRSLITHISNLRKEVKKSIRIRRQALKKDGVTSFPIKFNDEARALVFEQIAGQGGIYTEKLTQLNKRKAYLESTQESFELFKTARNNHFDAIDKCNASPDVNDYLIGEEERLSRKLDELVGEIDIHAEANTGPEDVGDSENELHAANTQALTATRSTLFNEGK